MTTIVHVTADHPDAFNSKKTRAVLDFLALTAGDYRHVVYSLNRINGIGGASIVDRTGDLATITYRAPPYGLLLAAGLAPVARLIGEDMQRRRIRPDLIHAHKLSIDGLVAAPMAETSACPLISNFWGNTDQKVIAAKPFSRARFTAVAQQASVVLAAAPWAARYAAATLALPPDKLRTLPIVCNLRPVRSSPPVRDRLVTMFNLDFFASKNVGSLIDAVALMRRNGRDVTLDIYGGGKPESTAAIAKHIERAGCHSGIALRGPVEHARVQEVFSRYSAFAMPSQRETFGMVFIEALFAGIPVIYPAGQAVDGYFDDEYVGRKCDARSVTDIAAQCQRVLDDEPALKRSIAELHARGYFRRFEPAAIAAAYRTAVAEALSTTRRADSP